MNLSGLAPAFLPSLAYFWKIAQIDQVIIADHFQYVKRSDAAISAPIGQQRLLLRVPVLHDKNPAPIFKKEINSSRAWRNKHYKTLKHIFNKAPFADYYFPAIEGLLFNDENLLSEFHIKWLKYFIDCLHLPASIHMASQIGSGKTNEESISLWSKYLSCNEYITDGPVYEKGWIKPDLLKLHHIKCRQFSAMPEAHILALYKDLSILEFLFQFGPEAGYILRQYLPSRK